MEVGGGLVIVVEEAIETEGFGDLLVEGFGIGSQVEVLAAGLRWSSTGGRSLRASAMSSEVAIGMGLGGGPGGEGGSSGSSSRSLVGGVTLASRAARVRTAWLRCQ